MRKAISYIRMSSESQLKGDSLARQIEKAKAYAENNNLKLLENDSLEDIGLSAYTGKHKRTGKLGLFLKGIDEGTVDKDVVLIVESLDRLSRENVLEAFSQFTKIINYGIELHSISDNQIYTKNKIIENAGQLFLSIGVMLRSYDESKIKSDRLKNVWKNKRKNHKNKIITRRVPDWIEYSEKKQKFILKEYESKVIKEMFRLCNEENMGQYSIARKINNDYPRSGNKNWGLSYIKKIFESKSVYGSFQPHKFENGTKVADGEEIENYFPAIITKDEFILARHKIEQRKNKGAGRLGNKLSNLFSGIMYCGQCNEKLVFINKGISPKGGTLLRCRASYINSGCSCPGWRYEEFEDSFLTYIRDVNLKEVLKKTDITKKRFEIEKEISVLNNELEDIEKSIQSYKEMVPLLDEAGKKDFAITITEKYTEKTELERKVTELTNSFHSLVATNPKEHQESIIESIKKMYTSKSDEQVKKIRLRIRNSIRAIVDKIIVNNNEYVVPWEIDNIDSRFIKLFEGSRTRRSEHNDIESYLSSDFGQREYKKYMRKFTVCFRDGKKITVQPSVKFAYEAADPVKEIERRLLSSD